MSHEPKDTIKGPKRCDSKNTWGNRCHLLLNHKGNHTHWLHEERYLMWKKEVFKVELEQA